MKRYLSSIAIFILFFLLVSCSETDEQPAKSKISVLKQHEFLTKSVADQIATGITRLDVENYLDLRRGIASSEIKEIVRYDIEEDVYVFIVNLNKGGWFVFSGDYSCPPILSLSEEGCFQIGDSLPRHDKLWLETVREYTRNNRNSKTEGVKEFRTIWTQSKKMAMIKEMMSRYEEPDTMEVIIEYYQDTLANDDYDWLGCPIWHEFAPFNNAVPLADSSGNRCPAGCAVIAIAELLYYTHYAFGYPNDIYAGATCSSLYSQQPYDFTFSSPGATSWNYMNPNWLYISNNDPYTAALCALISKRSQTTYGVDIYGAYGETSPYNIASTLDSFLLDGASMQYFYTQSVRNEIQSDRPVLCSGEALSGWGGYYEGHCYLIEGYRWFYVVETEIISDTAGNILSEETYTIINDLQWRVNTGTPGRRTYADGVYYPYNRMMYIGWD